MEPSTYRSEPLHQAVDNVEYLPLACREVFCHRVEALAKTLNDGFEYSKTTYFNARLSCKSAGYCFASAKLC